MWQYDKLISEIKVTVTYNGGLDPLVTNDFNFMLVISRPIRYRIDVTL